MFVTNNRLHATYDEIGPTYEEVINEAINYGNAVQEVSYFLIQHVFYFSALLTVIYNKKCFWLIYIYVRKTYCHFLKTV